MNYYQLVIGKQGSPDHVFLYDVPIGAEGIAHRLSFGLPAGADYPADAILQMTEQSRGTEVPSLIGNVNSFLIVHRDLKDVLASTGVPMECLPFTLEDRKGRVASRDHFIVNPLGTYDCIDRQQSELVYSEAEPTVLVDVEHLVLDRSKLSQAPEFFRIAEQRTRYVISERLGSRLAALNPTNVDVVLLEQSEAA